MTWIVTLSGTDFDFEKPDPATIDLVDIAIVLGRVARYAGHTRGQVPYTVAQHSVLVLKLAEDAMRLDGKIAEGSDLWHQVRAYAVMHDAPEAYTGDVTQPLKAMLGKAFEAIEDRVQEAVHARFGLPYPVPKIVKQIVKYADMQALATERRDLLSPTARMWSTGLPDPAPYKVVPVSGDHAYGMFLAAAREVLANLSPDGPARGYPEPIGERAMQALDVAEARAASMEGMGAGPTALEAAAAEVDEPEFAGSRP